jgi:8-oxo-dGTP pyrophosphatase MutT (NUDIX family)
MEMVEIKNRRKSGVIPFYKDDAGVIRMLFMVPSDPYYGGPRLQIAKGGIDEGETAKESAVREGIEELGLRLNNVLAVERGTPVVGLKRADGEHYTMEVFVALIHNPDAFDQPHYETGRTEWLTIQEFRKQGRRAQLALVEQAYFHMLYMTQK